MTDSAADRLSALDVLRFAAAMMVFFYHLTWPLPAEAGPHFGLLSTISRFGYLGVNLFFIISGFVILWSAYGRQPLAFVISRFARLYPTFWAALVLTTVILFWLRPDAAPSSAAQFLANVTMVPGRLGYEAVDGVYWTLGTELKFYALVWLLLVIRGVEKVAWWLIPWTALSYCAAAFPDLPLVRSATIFPYGGYFCAGCAAFIIWRNGLRFWGGATFLLNAALSIYLAGDQIVEFVFQPSDVDVAIARTVVLISFGLVAAVALRKLRAPAASWVMALGALTYPIYLLHNAIGKSLWFPLRAPLGDWAALVVTGVLVLGVSWIFVLAFERRAAPAVRRGLTRLLIEKPRKAE
jgi:peptidoglycan/LPS O-acetylase OafA/YrhL